MCVETTSLSTSLLPTFAIQTAGDFELLKLIFAYQKNPNLEKYNKVLNYLIVINDSAQIKVDQITNETNLMITSIVDYEGQLLWCTGPKVLHQEVKLLYAELDSNYNIPYASVYKEFESGHKYSLSVAYSGLLTKNTTGFIIGSSSTPIPTPMPTPT